MGKKLCKGHGKERMGIGKRQLNCRYLMICGNLYTLHILQKIVVYLVLQLNFAIIFRVHLKVLFRKCV